MTEPSDIAVMHEVGDRAIAWLHRNQDGFRPRQDDSTSDFEVKDRLKPIGELALIGKVLFREGVAGSRQAALTRQLLDTAWRDHLDGGKVLTWMQQQEPLSPIPFEIYVPFHELGYEEPAFEATLRSVHTLESWSAMETPPVRRLGISAFERRFGLPRSITTEAATAATWLGRRPEPWTVEMNVGYAVTHTVFHLTDWGENPGGLPDDLAEYLAQWLPAWVDDWLDIGHWDLLGELLVVDACLPEPALDPVAWRAFAEARTEDGAMPAQRGPLPEGRREDVFDALYHPTLVAAFASVLATSRAMGDLRAPAGSGAA
ncbi:DUF6895 family protein [Streptomyces lonarensis]|uniref:DUF6895 domain-containing protein n=1 Tax=Streptomyces lonarensis TaxID=700599 RepID=A0A7X6HYA9_9ACTN|nr:hypothetical protein [Streptomyces lonarensis]NJQ05220.1 hypothetical protein [Streptomyces lonarensis]